MKKILVADDDRTTCLLLGGALKRAGFAVVTAVDGAAALRQLRKKKFDLLLTDIWMPHLTGLQLLTLLRKEKSPPRVVVMTSDDTPETMLRAVREQAYHYVTKPVEPQALVELIRDALAAQPSAQSIEVISALPNWVELLVPCEPGAADRVHGFLMRLKADLPNDIRQLVAQAFRELLNNAIEWGGRLDPNQKVRISYLRAKRMLLYRIGDPGTGFRFEGLTHAAIHNPPDKPWEHLEERDARGMRPGGFGILMVQAMVDELLYNEAQNEVVFVKYLDQ